MKIPQSIAKERHDGGHQQGFAEAPRSRQKDLCSRIAKFENLRGLVHVQLVEKEELPNGSAYTQETGMMVTKMRIQATV